MPTAPEQEPAYRCAHCTRLLYRDELARVVCFLCEDRAGQHLHELPGLYDELADYLQPGAAPSGSSRISASKTAPLPVSLQPLNLRGPGGIVGQLQSVEDAWRETLNFTIAPFRGNAEQTLAKVSKFLINNLRWACDSYAEVSDDLENFNHLHAQAKNIVTGERRHLVPVVCRYLYDDQTECGAPMRIDINKAAATCPTCRTRWGREEWVALFEATRSIAA